MNAFEVERRDALRLGGGMMLVGALHPLAAAMPEVPEAAGRWANGPMRWFQLAFVEDDPGRYDQSFWIDYLQQIHAQGVCLSAGGGTAFYPTRIPYHGKARGLAEGQDPFGDLTLACKKLGMRVLARIDPHAMTAQAANAHPEWALTDAKGEVQRHGSAPDLTLTCAYGPYNFEFMPRVIEEIAARYPVDGFFGNRWSGSGTCYCASCRSLFRKATGQEIPVTIDTATASGKLYAAWLQERLFALIDVWNAAIRRHRPDAFFIPGSDRRGLVDLEGRGISSRLPLVFGDRQARSSDDSAWSVGTEAWGSGRCVKGLRAFMHDKPVGLIVSVGVEEAYRWKDSVQDPAEIRVWAAGALAQGARPWVTKFNAKPFDRRWMEVVRDLYQWHHKHERYFHNIANLAQVGLVVSSRTAPYLGGWTGRDAFEEPAKGFYQALLESRIPFDMIDDAFLDPEHLRRFRTLIFANAAVMSDRQCEQVRAFVKNGGRVVASYQTSLFDGSGARRPDFGLADLIGCSLAGEKEGPLRNSYITLRHDHPALGGLSDVPRTIGPLHRLPVTARSERDVALTLVPSYPDLPMERVYTDRPVTDIPMGICRAFGRGRVVYLPMDIDRTFAELSHGDHLKLLRAMITWAHDRPQPMIVEGPGMVDLAIWRQSRSLTAHLVNLNNPMTMRGSFREAIETGPYQVGLELPAGAKPLSVRLLESGQDAEYAVDKGRLSVTVPRIAVHEVIAVDLA